MKTILMYGMGADSSALLHRWLTDPTSRNFALADLIVISAMTGSEFDDTRFLVEAHILPLLGKHQVRFVQLARRGPKQEDGIEVLDDSRCPASLHIDGVVSIVEELMSNGTGPQVASRRCSIKYKGWVIDSWLAQQVKGAYRHVLGFNADEGKRVERDQCYGGENRKAEYPLMDWGWGRAECETYLRKAFGVAWVKSCCTVCPFASGKPDVLARYAAMPEKAAEALLLEWVAMALNPRMTLYATRSLISLLASSPVHESSMQAFAGKLSELEWAVYRVRRIYTAKGRADRSIEIVARGPRFDMTGEVFVQAARWTTDAETVEGHTRLYLRRRQPTEYPSAEEFYVAAPALAKPKAKPTFEREWRRVNLPLLEVEHACSR